MRPSENPMLQLERDDFFDEATPLVLVVRDDPEPDDEGRIHFTAYWWDDHRAIDDRGRRSDAGSPGIRAQVFHTELKAFTERERQHGRQVRVQWPSLGPEQSLTARDILDRVGPGNVGHYDGGSFVEQTGGGVATVFLGHPSDEGEYLIQIGPGVYDFGAPAESRFSFAELFVGLDDGEGTGEMVTDLEQLSAAVKRWLPEANARRRRAAGDWTEAELVEAWTPREIARREENR